MPRRVSPTTILVLLVAVSVAVRYWAATRVTGLWIMPDEAVYGLLARSLYEDGRFAILDGPTVVYSVVYPALAGLPLALGDLERGYGVLKAVQALVMSLSAVPVYLWGRTLMRPQWALVAAALTLAVPALLYAGFVMTEVAFYPVLVLAAWALARALERPSLSAGAILAGAVALAAATRLQALVLLPVIVTALVLHAAFERSAATLRRFVPALAGVAGLAAAWAAWRLAEGGFAELLGGYSAATTFDYSVTGAAQWTLYHLGDLLIATALFPLPALVLLAGAAVRGREESGAVRAYVATAIALVAWMVAQVGVFASGTAEQLLERDLIGLAPVLFLAFALWLDRGAPRSRVATSIVAFVALLVVVLVPLRLLVAHEALPDAFTFAALRGRGETTALQLVVYGGAALAFALFALVSRRFVAALPAAALAFLALASVAASLEVPRHVSFDDEHLLGGRPDWIDSRVREGSVAYVYSGEAYWNGVWQHLFWNRRVERVYYLDGSPVPGPLPQLEVEPADDGRLRAAGSAVAADYAVTSTRNDVFGEPVDRIEQRGVDVTGQVLWRVAPPLRLAVRRPKLQLNGDMYEPGRLVAYECGGGTLVLTLLPKASTFAELRLNGRLVQRVDFRTESLGAGGGRYWNGIVTAPPGMRRCVFEVRGNSLLGSTTFDFERAARP